MRTYYGVKYSEYVPEIYRIRCPLCLFTVEYAEYCP